jgi:tRNA pseudouridine55 synthase
MTLEELKEGTVLLFDKPLRWTSFDVVNKIKYLTRVKIGHAGTLDPLASGLLIILTGTYCKKMVEYMGQDKEYTGTFKFGATTPSHDLETQEDAVFDISNLTEEAIREKAKSFIGELMQTPPSHSAKHIDGKRYYDMARDGKEFERKQSKVALHEFEIVKVDLPFVDFRIVCSKGFYVRSLAHDFGLALNNGAYLSALRRTRSGDFKVEDAWQVDDFVKLVKELKANENESIQKP